MKPWYRILRLSLLLTIPGEPIAGFLLAASAGGATKPLGVMLAAAGAAVFFAVFAHLVNDLLDLPLDVKEHPDRPLPAGEITVPQARMAAVVAALSGLNLALFAGRPVLYAGVALCCLILARHAFLKRVPVFGALTAGLCRGLSFSMGALAANPEVLCSLSRTGMLLCVAAVCTVLYVSAVANLTKSQARCARWLPFGVLLPCLAAVLLLVSVGRKTTEVAAVSTAATSALAFLSAIALLRGWLLGGILYRSQPVGATVSGHFGNLLLVQGALCSAAGTAGVFPALTFILLSVFFKRLQSPMR